MDISKYSGVGGRGSRNMRGGRGSIPRIQRNLETPKETLPIEISNPLSSLQKQFFSSHFPNDIVKLSYETVAPKKVSSPEYDLCIAIPFGKKAYIWFTYYYATPICLLFELNRENQISDHISLLAYGKEIVPIGFDLGTVVSGTIYEKEVDADLAIDVNSVLERVFILDDIHIYKGMVISKFVFQEKTGFIYNFFLHISSKREFPFMIRLPVMWSGEEQPNAIPYNIRHIQHRSTLKIMPHINVTTNRKPVWAPNIVADSTIYMKEYKFNYSRPIYRKSTFFYVKADIAYDVYYLGALDKKEDVVFFQHSLVMNYKTSMLLNGIFRNIRENRCLDYIEESDDESDFENVREDKYVDLEKRVLMECMFHSKFKKWMPIKLVDTLEKPCTLDTLL
jgi:hypothetical protein